MITSNRSVGDWSTVFGDSVVGTAILDRILHHSTVITIRVNSFLRLIPTLPHRNDRRGSSSDRTRDQNLGSLDNCLADALVDVAW